MKNGEHPAFPFEVECEQANTVIDLKFQGLTKREYFAAIAMQGFLSQGGYHGQGDDVTAKAAVRQADALLKELEQ